MLVLSSSSVRLMGQGARDTLPLVLAAAPFGLVYGALGLQAGLTPEATLVMSLLVFAGSAQFVAVGLLAANTAWPVILLTTLVVNLRHMLYAANLLPHVRGLSRRLRVPMAFTLTDETFAVVTNRLNGRGVRAAGENADVHWYALGSGLCMYVNWMLGTAAGVFLGRRIPAVGQWGLDVAMVIAFVGIVVPTLKTRPQWASAASAFGCALLTHDWPHQSGLMVSALAGIAVGLWLDKPTEEAARV